MNAPPVYWILGWYAAASLLSFIVYLIDKQAARSGRWRIPEAHLHLLGLLGGWPGALIAQQTLRHKSVKKSFRVVFWMTVLINGAALTWLLCSGKGLQ